MRVIRIMFIMRNGSKFTSVAIKLSKLIYAHVIDNKTSDLPTSLGRSVLVCPITSLPRITANVWLSLNSNRYSKKHTRSHLQALDRFYEHWALANFGKS